MYKLFWPWFYNFCHWLCARNDPQRVDITHLLHHWMHQVVGTRNHNLGYQWISIIPPPSLFLFSRNRNSLKITYFDVQSLLLKMDKLRAGQKITSRDVRWPEVIRKWRHLTGSHLEVAVEGQNLAYIVQFTSYKAVARSRRQSRDWKWRCVTSGDRKWPGSNVICPEVTLKWLYMVKNSSILRISLPTGL